MPLIQVERLSKIYTMGDIKVPALKDISLNIQRGEFVAIMGPSGSGKSTFMNILGCLDRPTSGSYLLDGIEVTRLSKKELARLRNKKLGFVFQNFNLLSRTTALENVELPLLYSQVPAKHRRALAKEALRKVSLENREFHYPNQLSGGQQQRVAIARALVGQPPILLADEPTGNLDSLTSVEIMRVFQQLNEEGMTLILVTHEPDIAAYTRRVVTFRDGNIVQDRPVEKPLRADEELRLLLEARSSMAGNR